MTVPADIARDAPDASDPAMAFRFGDATVRINVADAEALRTGVDARLAAGEGFALATLNMDHLVKLDRDPDFRRAYMAQDFVVADGNPVVWLARLAGHRVALLPGSDLVVPLARAAAAADQPVAFLGSTGETLERAAAALCAAVPGLKVSVRIAPPMGYDPEGVAAADDLARIAASGAALCFVALGAPKQERLAAHGRRVAPGVGFACIGAGLDFLGGGQTRAPQWVRRIKMEWAWRMLSNPGRLARRYANCFAILPGQAVKALRQRGAAGGSGA